jgi:hypothetical protein
MRPAAPMPPNPFSRKRRLATSTIRSRFAVASTLLTFIAWAAASLSLEAVAVSLTLYMASYGIVT